ncbi:3-phosphoshikimate 1-carboxyvinyltransferase [Hominicoprocola fusiformis]
MKRTIIPGARTGRVRIPASKSQAHRLLICAALGEEKTEVVCDGISADIAATAKCLSALGAKIEEMETGFLVSPIKKVPERRCELYCGESGSTLRFLLPIVGALGAQAVFHREGRLPQRPLAPLDSVLKEHGMTLREDGDLLYCSGQLIGGNYTIAGNVSSQYISGLLMALPLLIRDSLLMVSGPLESAAYVAMTEDALQLSKLTIPKMGAMWAIPGQQRCHLPKRTVVEGDWSNTAFFLCMGALSKEGVTVEGLNLQSSQGDRGVLDVLRAFGAEVIEQGDAVTVKRGALHGVTINAAPIPDLIPVLSVVASVAEGETRVENAYRLRLKESDRLKSTANLLRALGGQVEEKEDGLVITGVPALHGGSVETQNDHRLAMSAATAACAATGEITVDNDGCVAKSYPRFWEDFGSLKGEGL